MKSNSNFSIQPYHGAPALFREGEPVFPLFFWQKTVEETDGKAFHEAGVRLFSFFCSYHYAAHPYWVGENEYDFEMFDREIGLFHSRFPDAFCIPRIFVWAPEWWLAKHPSERCGFALGDGALTGVEGDWQGTNHESFASELWKKEMGEAFRQAVRHLRNAPYAKCILGIHVCGGIFGEWPLWNPSLAPDTSEPMRKRFGREIPPPEKRSAEYLRCLNGATVEAIDHFCTIVKEESHFLTAVFYGYIPDLTGKWWRIEGDHRAPEKMHRLKSVDMVSAPHSYLRRAIGQDAYFRNYPASLALHGKFFLDEGDDRTHCDPCHGKDTPGTPSTLWESVQILRREFGNMLTHNIGLWYMDLNGGNFRDESLMSAIRELVPWGERSMKLSRRRNAEVAVAASVAGELGLPQRRSPGNLHFEALFDTQLKELCTGGAPFDFYVSADLDAEIMKQYKLILLPDASSLTGEEKRSLEELREKTVVREIGDSVLPAEELRTLYRSAKVHVYSESDDVFSVSESAMMLHASREGEKILSLPEERYVTEIPSGKELGNTREIRVFLRMGETALYLLEPKKQKEIQ